MPRHYRPLFLAHCAYRRALFRIRTREKILCLTFDDGPHNGSTERLVEILGKNGVRAVFFCCGIQAEKKPELMSLIRSSGHLVGNHGYIHLDGFKTSLNDYLGNVLAASASTSDVIFRPPYGRMTVRQYLKVSERFRVIMWDTMAYDFDKSEAPERSLEVMKKNIRPGSIIVLHDTPESSSNLFLEDFIAYCQSEGYSFVVPF